LPVFSGIPLDETSNRDTSSGPEVLSDVTNLTLESAWVVKVEWLEPNQLRFMLSNKGDEELRKFIQAKSESLRLAIVVQGWIEGISIGSIRDRQVVFRMGDAAKKTHTRIQAAIRGPTLPCEFELLD
jgi:hypothetical protein